MYEKLKDVIRKSDAKKGAQRCASQGEVVWTKTLKESFLSVKEESVQVSYWKSALRESPLSIWRVDINQALRWGSASWGRRLRSVPCVSWDRLEVPWSSWTAVILFCDCLFSRWECFYDTGTFVFFLFLFGFSTGWHAFVLLRPVGMTLDRTRSTWKIFGESGGALGKLPCMWEDTCIWTSTLHGRSHRGDAEWRVANKNGPQENSERKVGTKQLGDDRDTSATQQRRRRKYERGTPQRRGCGDEQGLQGRTCSSTEERAHDTWRFGGVRLHGEMAGVFVAA